MEQRLNEMSLGDFTARLTSTAPVPGGGGAAALMGALAASLCGMAAAITAGKGRYAHQAEELRTIAGRAEALRRELLALIDRDAEGFAPLARAYALPKGEPDTADALRAASLAACKAPWEMLLACREALELLETAREQVSPLLLSDIGCGAAACRAAMEAAAMNLFVNTRSLKGDGEAEALARRTGDLLDACRPRLEALAGGVLQTLQG